MRNSFEEILKKFNDSHSGFANIIFEEQAKGMLREHSDNLYLAKIAEAQKNFVETHQDFFRDKAISPEQKAAVMAQSPVGKIISANFGYLVTDLINEQNPSEKKSERERENHLNYLVGKYLPLIMNTFSAIAQLSVDLAAAGRSKESKGVKVAGADEKTLLAITLCAAEFNNNKNLKRLAFKPQSALIEKIMAIFDRVIPKLLGEEGYNLTGFVVAVNFLIGKNSPTFTTSVFQEFKEEIDALQITLEKNEKSPIELQSQLSQLEIVRLSIVDDSEQEQARHLLDNISREIQILVDASAQFLSYIEQIKQLKSDLEEDQITTSELQSQLEKLEAVHLVNTSEMELATKMILHPKASLEERMAKEIEELLSQPVSPTTIKKARQQPQPIGVYVHNNPHSMFGKTPQQDTIKIQNKNETSTVTITSK